MTREYQTPTVVNKQLFAINPTKHTLNLTLDIRHTPVTIQLYLTIAS